ncbi:MAG: DUF202 domain-containing protein [Chitinophagaceae bacterium]
MVVPADDQKGKISEHLANERTFLAWVRTSIAIMGLGFVVVKFSLFVKQLMILTAKPGYVPHGGFSAVVGIVLVASGALSLLLGYASYRKTEKQIAANTYGKSNLTIPLITCFLFLTGALLLVYLLKGM